MKIDFYFEWFPGMSLEYATANAKPLNSSIMGKKVYKFTVDIDDPNLPDFVQEVKGVLEPTQEGGE